MTEAPETIWAAIGDQEYPSEGGEFLLNRGDWVDEIKPNEYRRADLPPKVKALVWSDAVRYKRRAGLLGGLSCGSQNQIGNYSVDGFEGDTGTKWHSYFRGDNIGKDFASEESAKAAAQAHFEAIVLECIE